MLHTVFEVFQESLKKQDEKVEIYADVSRSFMTRCKKKVSLLFLVRYCSWCMKYLTEMINVCTNI